MTHYPLLGPVVALVAWTIVVMFWAIIRIQTAIRSGADLSRLPKGARGRDLEGHLAPAISWPRQNYEHLVEQPTLFYAIIFCLVFMGQNHVINQWLAWIYVGARVVHSLVQAMGKSRTIPFVASTLCLIALTLHAALGLLHG